MAHLVKHAVIIVATKALVCFCSHVIAFVVRVLKRFKEGIERISYYYRWIHVVLVMQSIRNKTNLKHYVTEFTYE